MCCLANSAHLLFDVYPAHWSHILKYTDAPFPSVNSGFAKCSVQWILEHGC